MQEAFSLTGVDTSFPIQNKKTLMYQLIRSLTPGDFLIIKSGFELYQKETVNVSQFVAILMDILHKNQNWSNMSTEVITLIELFSYIDYQNKEKIKFEDFTSFIIENEGIFAEEQNLDDYKVILSKQMSLQDVQASKVFPLDCSQLLGILQTSQKSLKLYSSRKLIFKNDVDVGTATIIAVVYFKKNNTLILSTNDKHLSFYDIQEQKLIRRFSLPDTLPFLKVNQQRQILFSGTPSGKLYTWSLKQIFSDFKITVPQKQLYKKFMLKEPIKQQQDLTCMIEVPGSQLLITGSNDSLIRLYQTKDQGLKLLKKLECHPKGITSLSYSESHKIIVSCAFDFDVLVWNAYLQYPVAKLVGHQQSLNSVYCPKNHAVILSLDSKGIMKIWNIKSFQLLQTIMTFQGFSQMKNWGKKTDSKGQDLNKSSVGFTYKEEFDAGIICLKKLNFYEFVVSHDPKLTDDNQLTAFVYSPVNLEIYIGSDRDLRVWSIQRGVLIRQFKKRSNRTIVCICLDKNHRRAFLGQINGDIVSINVFTGAILNNFSGHSKQISYIGYSNKHSLLVSQGWEGQIKIHNDTQHLQRIDKRGNVLRNIKNINSQDMIMGSYSDTMMLIASASRSPQCCIWDFEKGFFERDFVLNQDISCLHFLNPYPLIILADLKGALYIYIVKYHKKQGQLLLQWNNMYSIQKQAQVSVINSDYHKGQLTMLIGDEYGYVRIVKIQSALSDQSIIPITPQILGNKNPYRIQDYEYKSPQVAKPVIKSLLPLQPQKSVKAILQIKAHNQRVIQAIIIRQTHSFSLITCGDKLCKLWNQQGQNIGILRQGYLENPKWRFQLHSSYKTKQQNIFQSIMKNLNKMKDELRGLRRQKMIPFSSIDEDYQNMQYIDNNEIYQDLKEIQEYLSKGKPKSNKKLY